MIGSTGRRCDGREGNDVRNGWQIDGDNSPDAYDDACNWENSSSVDHCTEKSSLQTMLLGNGRGWAGPAQSLVDLYVILNNELNNK